MDNTLRPESVFACISNGYYHFTAAEKKVSDYVLNHKTGVQFMSISELADECGVAEATISRFCRRLDLQGYNAFKLAIAKAVVEEQGGNVGDLDEEDGTIGPDDTINELARKLSTAEIAAINQSLNLIRPEKVKMAADLLVAARHVYCMGQGGSMMLAAETAHLFSTVSNKFSAVADSHIQASTAALMDENDVLLFFSYSGSTKDIVELMGLAHSVGAKIILVTRFARSPGAAESDVVLQCGSNEGPFHLGSVTAKMAQLFIVDLLYHEFVRRDPESARDARERIATALADKHM